MQLNPDSRYWTARACRASLQNKRMDILRFRAFTTDQPDPASGNPAGVVMGAEDLTDTDMLQIAADLGFSETAFLTAITPDSADIRYFTPRAEIAFCGHATIASGVALARRGAGAVVRLATKAGEVPVEVGPHQTTLVAVHTPVEPLDDGLLDELPVPKRWHPRGSRHRIRRRRARSLPASRWAHRLARGTDRGAGHPHGAAVADPSRGSRRGPRAGYRRRRGDAVAMIERSSRNG